jgi:hypothetical protein
MPPNFPRSFRFVGTVSLIVASFFLLGPQEACGQYWRQTARLATPVENGPLRTFLDTLTHTIEEKELRVRRTSNQDKQMRLAELRDLLIKEHGTSISTANTLFIDYRFELDRGSRLERDIQHLQFHFRPGPRQEDIPLLYLDAQQKWMQDLLIKKGTPPSSNLAAIIPFRRHLEFAHLARLDDTDIVEIGGTTVREGFAVKKEELIQRLERLMYLGLV